MELTVIIMGMGIEDLRRCKESSIVEVLGEIDCLAISKEPLTPARYAAISIKGRILSMEFFKISRTARITIFRLKKIKFNCHSEKTAQHKKL